MLFRAAWVQRPILVQRRNFHNVFRNRAFSQLSAPKLLPASMKRKAPFSDSVPKAKRQKEPEKDYCDVETVKDSDGSIVWPAPEEAMEKARAFLREWYIDVYLKLSQSQRS